MITTAREPNAVPRAHQSASAIVIPSSVKNDNELREVSTITPGSSKGRPWVRQDDPTAWRTRGISSNVRPPRGSR